MLVIQDKEDYVTVEKVKEDLINHLGNEAVIKCNLGRNKFEKYHVTIKEIYNHIFLVEVLNKNQKFIKSFSYSDVITKIIKIDYSKIAF